MEPYTRSDFAAAETALSRFVDEGPDHAPAFLYLGVSRLQLDDTLGAVEPLERAAELGEHPDNQHYEGYTLGIQC